MCQSFVRCFVIKAEEILHMVRRLKNIPLAETQGLTRPGCALEILNFIRRIGQVYEIAQTGQRDACQAFKMEMPPPADMTGAARRRWTKSRDPVFQPGAQFPVTMISRL